METITDIAWGVGHLLRVGVGIVVIVDGVYAAVVSLVRTITPWGARGRRRPIDLAFGLLMVVAGVAVLVA
uniref:Uncharacterized protein n=1 Tax=viral metagenome TaxID=1070528 RepID=A0A6M3LSR1_9ZZZZ